MEEISKTWERRPNIDEKSGGWARVKDKEMIDGTNASAAQVPQGDKTTDCTPADN